MRIEVQLHATLTVFLPPASRDGIVLLEVDEGATVADVIRRLAIPMDLSRIVLVNGHDVEDDAPLPAGAIVDIFPPLAGGAGTGMVHSGGFFGSV